MKKIIKWFLILILLGLVGLVIILGYLGFFPGLASFFGSDKPRDLGVKYSPADYTAYQQKAGTQTVPLSTATSDNKSLTFSGKKDLTVTFTEAEVSSRISHSIWKYMPLADFQIRFPAKDTLEFSGLLMTDRLSGFISQVGNVDISQADIDRGLSYLKIFSKNTPVYAKARVNVVENKAYITLQKLEIGRFPIPINGSDLNNSLSKFADELMSKNPGFYAKMVTFEDGKMSFTGTVPDQISALTDN